jgi:hypothetical protein
MSPGTSVLTAQWVPLFLCLGEPEKSGSPFSYCAVGQTMRGVQTLAILCGKGHVVIALERQSSSLASPICTSDPGHNPGMPVGQFPRS